jgi:hypothetical protein
VNHLMLTVPLELLNFCEEQGLTMDGHLIDNPLALSLAEAQQFSPKWVLRWSNRKCHRCDTNFNISQEGLYYCCHDCLNGESE